VVVTTRGENGNTFQPNPQQNNSSQSNRAQVSVAGFKISGTIKASGTGNSIPGVTVTLGYGI
jgi:hypothetical protein